MKAKISVRLSATQYVCLLQTAQARGVTQSDLVRESLGLVVDGRHMDPQTPRSSAGQGRAPLLDLDTCVTGLMARLPSEAQAVLRARAEVLALPLARVVMAGLVQAFQP